MLDIVLGLLLLAGAWAGWRSGAISMLLSVVILIAAAYLASIFASQVGAVLKIGPSFSRPVLGFFFLFVLILVAGAVLRRSIKPKGGISKTADQTIGAFLGVLRSGLILGFFLFLINLVELPPRSMVERSILYRPLLTVATSIAAQLKPFLPQAIHEAGLNI